MNITKHSLLVVSLIALTAHASHAMGGAQQIFFKAGTCIKKPLFEGLRRIHTEPGHVDSKAGHEHSTLFNDIAHVQLLKKQKHNNLKKSALWGFSAFNGFVYSVGFALNQELLQPFVQSPVGLVAASACFTMLAAYNAKQCFNEKKKAEFDLDKLSSHIKVA